MKLKNFSYFFLSMIVGSLLVIFVVGSILSAPNPIKIGVAPDNFPAKSVHFQSQNGNELSGWYLEGSAELGGVLLMHGVRSNRLQMLNRAKFLNKAGYSVLLFDFQAHGESPGKYITFGYLESGDATGAFNYLKNQLSNKSIGVIGVSLGGAAALLGEVSYKADALILESVYPTIEEAVSNRLAMRVGFFSKLLSPLLLWQMEPRLGFSAACLRPIDHIANTEGAIFIIAGEKDLHTTLSESQRLYKTANEPKEIWVIANAAHIDFCRFKPDLYRNRVLDFLGKHLISINNNRNT